MSNKIKHHLWSFFKYLAIFVALYGIINLWRSPVMPSTPTLYYQNAQGQVVDAIKDSHHTTTLVYFWGVWCRICHLTSPNVQALHDDGYRVLTVAVSSGNDQELKTYLSQHHYDFAVINDSDSQLFHAWHGKAVPSFVILQDGKLAQGFTGVTPLWLLKFRLWWANVF